MNFVNCFEKYFCMHGTMRPVEVGVVKYNHHEDAEKEICETIFLDLIVCLCVLHDRREEYNVSDDRENECRNDRVRDLPNVIAAQWKSGLYSLKSPRFFFENVENKKCDGGENQVSQKNNKQ